MLILTLATLFICFRFIVFAVRLIINLSLTITHLRRILIILLRFSFENVHLSNKKKNDEKPHVDKDAKDESVCV